MTLMQETGSFSTIFTISKTKTNTKTISKAKIKLSPTILHQSAPPASGGGLSSQDAASSSASRTGRSLEEKKRELSMGSNLVNNDPSALSVMDFGAVKDGSSKAETALMKARQDYLTSLVADMAHAKPQMRHHRTDAIPALGPSNLMGINQEVLKEVGHDIGAFVNDPAQVQECGAWLRSTAPAGFFKQSESIIEFDSSKVYLYKSLLAQSYQESGEVTSAFAKTFYLGTQLMHEDAKRAIWAIYVWCRRTDEIVDAPRNDNSEMLRDLSEWEIRLERLWDYGEVVDVLDLPLLHVRIKYPALDIQPFIDMIRGMLMDIPDLGQDRYDTFDELHLYCYRVAGTVGLMSMPVFGCAPGCTDADAKEPALSLGVAFQLTNILRDVGEDADRGRIYLPQEDLEKFGVTEDQIFSKQFNDNYLQMMKFQIARARRYYARAKRGVPMLKPESRWPVQASLDCYSQILDKIEENNYDSLSQRAYVSKWEKLATLPASWYRTLDIAKTLPLPGDDIVKE